MKVNDFINKLIKATEVKTLYVSGGFGAPMTPANKQRYINGYAYNKRNDRVQKINNADANTFGFDCICLIKGILWGWDNNSTLTNGGAVYGANNVPDCGDNNVLNYCTNVTTNFANIQRGAIVWMQGHVGVYIGEGKVIESTPSWKDGVQITYLRNVGATQSPSRTWTKWGLLPWVDYGYNFKYDYTKFVKDVQGVIGAGVDGKVGNDTLSHTITINMNTNQNHPVVYMLQKRLKELGYIDIQCTGVYDKQTYDIIKQVQKAIGNTGANIDGEITAGQKTWKYLLGVLR